MGLLDDAIREHLELKRRHGASSEEIARKEAEAFGPARREPSLAIEDDLPAAEADEPYAAPAAEMQPDDATALVEGDVADPDGDWLEPEPVAAEPAAAEPEPEPDEPEADVATDDGVPVPDEPEAAVEPEPAPVEGRRSGDTPPYGFPAVQPDERAPAGEDPDEDEPLPPEPAGEDDDVLEETPDFLQETPEHDRLWFEQAPPRDFDFDD